MSRSLQASAVPLGLAHHLVEALTATANTTTTMMASTATALTMISITMTTRTMIRNLWRRSLGECCLIGDRRQDASTVSRSHLHYPSALLPEF